MTDEGLEAIRKMWHDFRRVELYCGDPDSEAKLKDELVTDIPALLAEVERLRQALEDTERALMREQLSNQDIAELVDTDATRERDTLWSENAALREIVQAVADSDAVTSRDHGLTVACEWCGGRLNTDYSVVEHTDNCVYTKARALMASEETD